MAVFFVFIFGLIIGSFLNVVIYRLHEKKNFFGRSFCQNCKKIISWRDNIPLFGFLNLKGRCRFCQAKISLQYPLVELAVAVFFVLAYLQSDFSVFDFQVYDFLFLIRDFGLISFLIIVFVYDLRWYLILDSVVIPAIIFAVAMNLFLGYGLMNLLLGIIIGGGFFLVQFLLSSGRWIGGGDIRLGILMGAILGWKLLLVAMFLAYVVGSIISIGLIFSKRKKFSSKIPFGTFLSAATIASMLYGEIILQWYLNFLF